MIISVFLSAFHVKKISGNYLDPDIKDGDLVLINCWDNSYMTDEVIVFSAGSEIFNGQNIGRVAAVAGDVISYSNDGDLLVNGTYIDAAVITDESGRMLRKTDESTEETENRISIRVPEGVVYVTSEINNENEPVLCIRELYTDTVQGKITAIFRRKNI